MTAQRSIFSQLLDFVPRLEFHRGVARYRGNHNARSFSCWDQFLCMLIAYVSGVKISSPKDSASVQPVLKNAETLHLKNGKSIEDAPFRGIFGRTGDTERGGPGCRVLVGGFDEIVAYVAGDCDLDGYTYNDVGLLAAWN